MVQAILSESFHKQYPQPFLSNEDVTFLRKNVSEFRNGKECNKLYHSFRPEIEEEYKRHLLLQPEGTIVELPASWGLAMSHISVFWMVFDGGIYQIETKNGFKECILVVRRF